MSETKRMSDEEWQKKSWRLRDRTRNADDVLAEANRARASEAAGVEAARMALKLHDHADGCIGCTPLRAFVDGSGR